MKLSILFSVLCLVVCSSFAEFSKLTLENTELHPLESKLNGRGYELIVSLPASYDDKKEKVYPVLYVLDGYWDAKLVNSMYGNLDYDKTIPEFITVGVAYSDKSLDPGVERSKDMVPAKYQVLETNPDGRENVNGETFLNIFKEEIFPYVEGTFRIDHSYRVLSGSSLGGFFVLDTLFKNPELFNGYIAISPAVGNHHRYLYQQEAKYRVNDRGGRIHESLPARLFMSAAENEWFGFRGEILAFDQILKHSEYTDFQYQFRLVDDEFHAGTKAEGYSRGIRYAFQPYLNELMAESNE